MATVNYRYLFYMHTCPTAHLQQQIIFLRRKSNQTMYQGTRVAELLLPLGMYIMYDITSLNEQCPPLDCRS